MEWAKNSNPIPFMCMITYGFLGDAIAVALKPKLLIAFREVWAIHIPVYLSWCLAVTPNPGCLSQVVTDIAQACLEITPSPSTPTDY